MKQDIQWNRLAVEAFVIVGSILLAFAIDAWWDRTQQIQNRSELILRLDEAISVSNEAIDRRLVIASERDLDPLKYFLELDVDNIPEFSNVRARTILGSLGRGVLNTYNSDVLLALLDVGNIILLSDAALQDRLAMLRSDLNTILYFRDANLELEDDMLRAMGKHPEIIPFVEVFGTDNSVQLTIGTEAIQAARSDIEIVSLAVTKRRRAQRFVTDLQRIRDDSEETLALMRTLIR